MAIYRTTDTELTSIADAIRAKTGSNSSLIYPTGFVSAIQGITASNPNNLILKDSNGDTTSTSTIDNNITLGVSSVTPSTTAQIITPGTGYNGFHTINVSAMPTYNWIGEDATLVSGAGYEATIKLSDTSFNASSITTSNTTLLDASNLSTVYVSGDYDYVQKTTCSVHYEYTGSPELKALITDAAFCGIVPMGQRGLYYSDLMNNVDSYLTYNGTTYIQISLYYTTSGSLYMTGNIYGISFAQTIPGFVSQSSATPGITLKTPSIRMNYNNSYMSQASVNAIDADKTIIYLKTELYRVNKSGLFRGLVNETYNLCKQNNTIQQ